MFLKKAKEPPKVQFKDAIKHVVSHIKRVTPGNITYLFQFFGKYVWYKNRVFEPWELAIMFKDVDDKYRTAISEENKIRNPALSDGQIELEFLVDEISHNYGIQKKCKYEVPNQPDFEESEYITKIVSEKCKAILLELKNQSNYPNEQYNILFEKTKTKRADDLDFWKRFKFALKKININADDQTAKELCNYFGHGEINEEFNKFQFVQGLKVWHDHQRPEQKSTFNNNVGGNYQDKTFIFDLPSENQQWGQQNQNQQLGYQNQNQQWGYQNQNIDWNQNNQFAPQNQLYQNQQLPLQLHQLNPKQIQRLNEWVLMEHPFIQNQNQIVEAQMQLLQLECIQIELKQLGSSAQFQPQIAGLMPQSRFSQIIQYFGQDLELIHEALLTQHLSIYQWFKGHANHYNEDEIDQDGFLRSIQQLNIQVPHASDDIYLALQQTTQRTYESILISDVEELFKAFVQRRNPTDFDYVREGILKLYYNNIQMVYRELNSIQNAKGYLTVEDFVTHFNLKNTQCDQKYYSLHDITALAEIYITSHGHVDLNRFMTDLQLRQQKGGILDQEPHDRNQFANRRQQEIRKPTAQQRVKQHFNSDMTRAFSDSRIKPRPNQFERSCYQEVVELIKGCLVHDRFVKDLYYQPQNYHVSLEKFIEHTQRVTPDVCNIEDLYNDIAKQMLCPHPTAYDIDCYVHYYGLTIKQIHTELLQKIFDCVRKQGKDLLAELHAVSRMGNLSIEEFNYLQIDLGCSFDPVDLKFVTSKYLDDSDNIDYQELAADVGTQKGGLFQKAEKDLIQFQNKEIYEKITKALFSVKKDINWRKFLTGGEKYLSPFRKNEFLSQMIDVLRLDESELPALEKIYNQLDKKNSDQVEVNDFVQLFKANSVELKVLKKPLLLAIKRQNYFKEFPTSRKFEDTCKLSLNDFLSRLTKLGLSDLNARFLAADYENEGQVDCELFVSHVAEIKQ